jgi:formyl-CoA transferase
MGINRNKRSLTLDLRSERGRELFFELVEVSDVVIDNFRAGVTERLGIDHAACAERKPDIITCSITAFGEDGPYRDLPAFDLILQAMGGGMSITGEPGRPPVRMGIPIGDLAGGIFGAFAVCAALYQRSVTGKGQHLDLGLLDAQVSLLTYVAQYHWADGRVPGPIGSGHQSVVPYQVFEASDRPLVVAVFIDRHWPPFCRAIGLDELAEPYARNVQRVAARDTLVPIIAERLGQRTADEWIEALRAEGVPCGPVNTVDRVLTDPQVVHRGMVAEAARPHPVAGPHHLLGNPIKTGEADVFEPSPLLGEHDEAIIVGLLGHKPEELERWRSEGVI